jgi:mRNA-degrading endonuclease RelE of RelBE toxin-antitoxin system
MSYKIIATDPFARKLKRLSKKYSSLLSDLSKLVKELELNPTLGISLGNNCFKIRISISSKNKGKSGGGRIITFVKTNNEIIYLLDIFDKSEQANISNQELKLLIEIFGEE